MSPELFMEASTDRPSPRDQLSLLSDSTIEEDKNYYLISREWWDKLKDSLMYKFEEVGPIDNTPILENGDLKESLMERIDYMILNENQWNSLVSWYGSKCAPIIRKSYKNSFYSTVEVYPFKITVTFEEREHKFVISKYAKVRELMEQICTHFQVENDENVRLVYDDSVIIDFEKKIDNIMGYKMTAVLQKKDASGNFPEIKSYFLEYSSARDQYSSYSSNYASSSSNSFHSGSYSSYSQPIQKGAVGLSNLGNTCFMNSSLQCLSNTIDLKEYFLSENYLKEINRDNPLGMKGEIAENFGSLIKEIWNSRSSSVSPRDLKYVIGQFAPQFSGYAQHDSQELLAFLLDGLHEDMNRIIKKPYIEAKDLTGTDEEMAKEAWENHKKRNDSIIVDLFQGQFKSRVRCPNCPVVSNTFDPFMYLSLPLPIAATKEIKITMKYCDPKRKPLKFKISVHKRASIPAILEDVAKIVNIKADLLTLCEIWQHGVRQFSSYQTASSIDEKDIIYCYENEMTDKADDEKAQTHTNIFVSHITDGKGYSYDKFSTPLRMTVPRQISFDELYHKIKILLAPYTNDLTELESQISAQNQSNEEPDAEQAKDEKYIFKIRKSYYDKDIDLTSSVELQLDSQIYTVWSEENKGKAFLVENEDFESHESLTRAEEDQEISLKSCLEIFRREEMLSENDMWFCPSCKEHRQAFKKVDLWSLPEILVIHFKRFSYSSYYRDKIDNFIEFPITDLDMSPYVSGKNIMNSESPLIYDLYAVSNHFGGMGGGHYTAYAKNDGQWFCYDDSNVSKIEESQVKSNAAYVLFYRRRHASQDQNQNQNHSNGDVDVEMKENEKEN